MRERLTDINIERMDNVGKLKQNRKQQDPSLQDICSTIAEKIILLNKGNWNLLFLIISLIPK